MKFLQKGHIIFYTSQKYEEIYFRINKDLKYGYKEIFLLFAAIGAKNSRKSQLDKRGREFRASFLNDEEANMLYAILLNDPSIGKDVDVFNDPDKQTEMKKMLEQYADRKSTRLNSSHVAISYAVFCLKKKKKIEQSQGDI